jgi:prevent-host-death family protein
VEIPVSDAKGQLTELLRRAEEGEEVILTRHGRPAGRIVPIARPRLNSAERLRIIRDIQHEAAAKMTTGPVPAWNHDDLYDENGLPK